MEIEIGEREAFGGERHIIRKRCRQGDVGTMGVQKRKGLMDRVPQSATCCSVWGAGARAWHSW